MKALPASKKQWPTEWREDYEERAAIIEYCGNVPRREAEKLAEQACREAFERINGN